MATKSDRKQGLASAPMSAAAVREQATQLARVGQREMAATIMERWLFRHPQDYELWLWLGDLRQQAGAVDSAIEAWRSATGGTERLRLTALLRIGGACLQTVDVHGAREAFVAAVKCAGRSAEAHCGLAAAAAQLGDFETVYREAVIALSLDPHCYTAWYQLTLAPDIDIERKRAMQLAARQAADVPAAWLLHIALGRVLERSSDYDAAFAAYSRGQTLRLRAFGIDFTRQRHYFTAVRQHLDKAFLGRQFHRETSSSRPIFVVGMPRSGTTLVEAILAAHPHVAAGGEMRFVYDWLHARAGSAATAAAVEWLAQTNDGLLTRLVHDWCKVLRKAANSRPCVTDKFPLNFTLVGLLVLCFPEASIVHVRRDPRDTCVSCYTTALYGDAIPATLTELGACYNGYRSLMRHWRSILGENRIVEVSYERLVQTPEPAMRKLLTEVGLDWHPECMNFYRSRRAIATASLYQVRQPIYRHSIGRWRRFEKHLTPLFNALEGATHHSNRHAIRHKDT